MEVMFHAYLTSALNADERSASTLWTLFTPGKTYKKCCNPGGKRILTFQLPAIYFTQWTEPMERGWGGVAVEVVSRRL
jgi:hypothetical protein